jgi:hypothetical protein
MMASVRASTPAARIAWMDEPGALEGEDDSAESVAFLPPSGEPDVVLANLRTIYVNR